ncbi:thioredoxin [[Clostridium] aminophilum]|uniref:thioredoxin n=1 Tax=[Clostridium] aminophilum TaxID=1526 RepID=UPI0026F03D3A|nr:thioredoxin [[Clostridium] aminophilum]MDD6197117.1 thioredoxin [[Clostridium] aminophilum]
MEYKFDSKNFEEEVLKSDVPVLVDFYADWCGPCKMMAPVVAKFAEEFDGKVKVGKINVDDNGEIAQKYGVMSIPNFKFFKNGEVVDNIVGAVNPDMLREKVSNLLG